MLQTGNSFVFLPSAKFIFQSLAVHLAMQQQYMLAAQQQQLAAMPGVFLPNPYIIAAPNTGRLMFKICR